MAGPYLKPTDTTNVENLLRQLQKPRWIDWAILVFTALAAIAGVFAVLR